MGSIPIGSMDEGRLEEEGLGSIALVALLLLLTVLPVLLLLITGRPGPPFRVPLSLLPPPSSTFMIRASANSKGEDIDDEKIEVAGKSAVIKLVYASKRKN